MVMPLYTGAATFVFPLCDHKTGQVAIEGTVEAERLPWSFKGGTDDIQTSPWMFKTVAQRSLRTSVAHRSLKGGRRKAHSSSWSQNECTWVGHLSPCRIIRTVVNIVHPFAWCLYPLYTGAATFLPPLCDPKSGQVAVEGRKEAERLLWSLNGGTQDVQTSPWTPWSPWSFEHVKKSRTKVAEEVGRSQVARRRQEEGTHIAIVAEWMHSGRPLVAP